MEKFIVYGREGNKCPFCVMAKNHLEQNGHDFEYVIVDEYPDILKFFREQGFRSVPQIYVIDEPVVNIQEPSQMIHIGGHDDLVKFLRKRQE